MDIPFKRAHGLCQGLGVGLLASLPMLFPMQVQAELSGANMLDYVSNPVISTESATPQVMFVMGKDHSYFQKAYNDFTDLDGNGLIDKNPTDRPNYDETTYVNDFEYYGYFDPNKCYGYEARSLNGNKEVFFPAAAATDHKCDGTTWSGNFLNWATMTRMDIVRKVMFGGKRLEDQLDYVILARAILPTDGHAFAKYYNGDDINRLTPFSVSATDGITLCNVTAGGNASKTDNISQQNNPPRIRVAKGNFSLWASNHRWQCMWSEEESDTLERGTNNSNGNIPADSGIAADVENPSNVNDVPSDPSGFGPSYNVWLLACQPGLEESNCKQYPNGAPRPVGLMQEYGDDELIHFGLMSGSYLRNLSGGVLRANIGPLGNEIVVDDFGQFKADPNSAQPSVGVTRAVDMFRLVGYSYDSGLYFGNKSTDDCPEQQNDLLGNEGDCWAWGNPISEMYMEAIRYFAGLQLTTAFDAKDTTIIGGLDEDVWEDPLDENNYCASLNTIVFNTSVNSYDLDQTSPFDSLAGTSAANLTNTIGVSEGVPAKNVAIGNSTGGTPAPSDVTSNSNELCTGKNINNLGVARGLCSEAPSLQGGYQIAGMAHYAKTEDIRPELEGIQNVTTYGLELSTNTPTIVIPVADGKVTIFPAYRLLTPDSTGNPKEGRGTLIDFKVIEQTCDDVTGTCTQARYYVNWDDSEQGGDYDSDVWGTIEYNYDASTNKIRVTTDVIAESSYGPQLFGFNIFGTTEDGFHAYSGIEGATYDHAVIDTDCSADNYDDTTHPLPADVLEGNVYTPPSGNTKQPKEAISPGKYHVAPAKGQCDVSDPAVSHEFTINTENALERLETPLYYAAKWGAFIDSDGDKTPNLQQEWDSRINITGLQGQDGVPDSYFLVDNPAKLEDALRRILEAILERVASGTAAAVVSNEQNGIGAVYQALYEPKKTDDAERQARWFGTLHSLFIDSQGFLREDGNGNARLDDYDTDKVVQVFFDSGSAQRTRVRRFSSTSPDTFEESSSTVVELTDLNTLWNAREELSALNNVTTQRTYTSPANNGRYITTWIDTDLDGVVDDGEQVAFDATTFDSSNHGWLDQIDENAADELVNYIRGQEIAGKRNRTLDHDDDGSLETQRLGDIVNSTPTVVAPPAEAFDLLSGDPSYGEFRRQYVTRRQVVYVGANDGVLHAFNAGFYDANTQEFKLSVNGETAHPLGAEIWAYVPKNLLPHLQWLPRDDYEHVYYVDLKPRVFDAKIFPDDATHPNGWGTVLVAGFRLGGGTDTTGITVDTAWDGLGDNNADDGNTQDDVKTKSAYVVLDITDPEQPPELIAELTPDNLQFATSFPAVALIGAPSVDASGIPNEWFLLFGSGPNNLSTVTSSQTARLYAYNLKDMVAGDPDQGLVTTGPFTGGSHDLGSDAAFSFVGDPVVADYDLDMKAEAMYFGTIGDTNANTGKLFRLAIGEDPAVGNWGNPQVLLNADQPFVAQPSLTLDERGIPWVIAGTGRFYSNQDKPSTSTQTLYGFKDPNFDPNAFVVPPNTTAQTVQASSLFDVSDTRVFTDGTVDVDGDGSVDMSHTELVRDVDDAGGWRRDYISNGSDPAQRSVNRSSVLAGVVLNTAFTPSLEQCGREGQSALLALGFNTGAPPPNPVLGTLACASCPDGVFESRALEDLGLGLASTPSIHIGKPNADDVPGRVTVVIQKSTGEIENVEANVGPGVRGGEISWREFINE